MHAAILHKDNYKTYITADDYQSRLRRRGVHGTWITCPECGQPVVARAMDYDSFVGPYFEHESDDSITQECIFYKLDCPTYRDGGDSYGEYTADMFLQIVDDSFILLVGYPALSNYALRWLEDASAYIRCGASGYSVESTFYEFRNYEKLYYTVDGPSFGPGLGLGGPLSWPEDTPLLDIEHTLNGCMLFEELDEELDEYHESNYAERLNARSIDRYHNDNFMMVYSTVDGMDAAVLVEAISSWFKVVGAVEGSCRGKDELRVAKFSTTKRDALKVLFP